MKRLIPILALCAAVCFTAPVAAQDSADSSKTDEGLSLLDQGMRLLFEGLMQDMEPALEDLKGLAEDLEPRLQALVQKMGPALTELLDMVDDIQYYEPPKMMPNGDIILRRKPDAPAYVAPAPETPIDL